jgi:hypothetical protein
MMTAGNDRSIGGSQIVWTGCGRGTGDVIHQTADGTYWQEVSAIYQPQLGTGERIERMEENTNA